jgi:hypothetical protein
MSSAEHIYSIADNHAQTGVIEAAATVADVEDHAALLRGEHRRASSRPSFLELISSFE